MEQLVFTRYLYPKPDVKQSLLLALLENNTKEALFWAYELYFSGFEEDTVNYLTNIYEYYYKSENPDLDEKLFAKNEYDDCTVGTMVQTLSHRKYQVCEFMRVFKLHDCASITHALAKMRFIILFKEKDLVEYSTILPEKEKARLYLKSVCKYSIRREYNKFFESSCDDFKDSLWYHWLYFASNSQIWLDRITEFGGKKNDETMKVDFPNDDLSDCFYDNWGLEPDEQSKDLQDKMIGKSPVTQLSINDFCDKYGSIKAPLTNSISLAV
jgi:hypothetical protein